MAKEKSADKYVFPGMKPFLDQVGEDKGLDLHQLGRAQQGWHMSQLQQLLGQLPGLDPDSQLKMVEDHIYPVLASLDGSNEAAKAAVKDALTGCDIPFPDAPGRAGHKTVDKKK